MNTKINNNNEKLDPGFWIGLVLLIMFLVFSIQKCKAQTAQYDTVHVNRNDIAFFITKNTAKSERIYAVFQSKEIQDLVLVPKTVYEYIELCDQNKITPNLGVKLKNGQIVSVIKYKPKYVIKRRL